MARPQRKKSTDPEVWQQIKHYKPADFQCRCGRPCSNGLVPIAMNVVRGLDEIRETIGLPIKIFKGVACKQSAHLDRGPSGHHPNDKTGLAYAVDVEVPNSEMRYEMLRLATQLGFNMIGVGKNFLHLEMDPDRKEPVLWLRPPTRKKR